MRNYNKDTLFTTSNATIFSGDTTKCDGLKAACQEADLFICDTSSPKGKGNAAHMDTHDIGEVVEFSKVKQLVLTHFYPQFDEQALMEEVKDEFSGKVIIGQDLSAIEL